MTGYYALDHPNPNAIRKGYPGFWGYTTMLHEPTALVVHTTESLADLNGPDTGAENVANWFQTNDTFALYHTLVDSDSTVPVVPAGLDGTIIHTAFHCAGYNSHTIGLSMALRADSWPSLPAEYANRVLDRAAVEAAKLCKRWNLPIVARAKHEIDAGHKGITGHGILDPGWRSDPGAFFPWDLFIHKVKTHSTPTPTPQPDEDDMKIVTDDNGTVWLVGGNSRRRVVPADIWQNTEWAIKQLLMSGVASEWIQEYTDKDGNHFHGVPLGALERIPEV